jgi:acyl dehydratase
LINYRRHKDKQPPPPPEPVAQLGPSPGFRELKWLRPVYVGDTISYATEVVEARSLNSRPGWGIVSVRNTGVNQRGEPVMSFISTAFIECRDRGPQEP